MDIPENENINNEEISDEDLPARYISVSSTMTGRSSVPIGETIILETTLHNFREDDLYSCQWQYDSGDGNYISIDDATDLIYTYDLSFTNYNYKWRILVTLENE